MMGFLAVLADYTFVRILPLFTVFFFRVHWTLYTGNEADTKTYTHSIQQMRAMSRRKIGKDWWRKMEQKKTIHTQTHSRGRTQQPNREKTKLKSDDEEE